MQTHSTPPERAMPPIDRGRNRRAWQRKEGANRCAEKENSRAHKYNISQQEKS
jgi:hypothetical protein